MQMAIKLIHMAIASLFLLQLCGALRCGRQAGNAFCPRDMCCNSLGWCGSTSDYCGDGCQSGLCTCEPCLNTSSSLLSETRRDQVSYYTQIIPSSCYGNDSNQFPANHFFAAANARVPKIWNGGKNCGKWLKIKCIGNACRNSDTISVMIVDRFHGGFLFRPAFRLSDTAFKTIAKATMRSITVEYSGPYESP